MITVTIVIHCHIAIFSTLPYFLIFGGSLSPAGLHIVTFSKNTCYVKLSVEVCVCVHGSRGRGGGVLVKKEVYLKF